MTRLTVIILTRDRPDLLRQCLDALARSLNGGPPPDVVVWDNGGDPQTAELCQERHVTRLGIPGENVSFAHAHNLVAKHVKGDLLLLNNDCLLQPGCLEAMVRERKRGLDIVGAKLLYPNGLIQHFGIGFSRDYQAFHIARGHPQSEPWAQQNRVVVAATGACLLIRRACWDTLGGFDERFVFGWEDVDLCLRAREEGYLCGVVADAVAIHLESQTAGRAMFDGPNWDRYQDLWVKSGRIFQALGVWPTWVANVLPKVHGPDAEMARELIETGD